MLCCAVLCSALLCCVVLCCAVLYYAVLCCALLYCAVLCSAVLCCAVLCCVVLCCALLCSAVLCCTMLCCALLCCAVLCCAVLCCAVLCCAVLCCALLCCAALCYTLLCSQHSSTATAARYSMKTRKNRSSHKKLFVMAYFPYFHSIVSYGIIFVGGGRGGEGRFSILRTVRGIKVDLVATCNISFNLTKIKHFSSTTKNQLPIF